jgi:hypothetical protein
VAADGGPSHGATMAEAHVRSIASRNRSKAPAESLNTAGRLRKIRSDQNCLSDNEKAIRSQTVTAGYAVREIGEGIALALGDEVRRILDVQ